MVIVFKNTFNSEGYLCFQILVKKNLLAPRLNLGILGHTEKSDEHFPFKSTLEIYLHIGLSNLRKSFEKFHLFMRKISIHQNLKKQDQMNLDL